MTELRKFIVASSEEEAELNLSVWNRHGELREGLSNRVFDDKGEALKVCADLIRQAEDESPFGCKVPCDQCSRCAGFHPRVWEIRLSVSLVTG